MGKFIDLTGQRFGRLTVVKRVENNKHGHAKWLCQCECGKHIIVCGYSLKNNNTKSCGCFKKISLYKKNYKHGHSCRKKTSKTYQVWEHMIRRCKNPNVKNYKNYGGRGIKVCEAWLKFENFLQDMGERPEGLSIDRIDNDGNYYKENCKWSTRKEQNRNKRNNILITINGVTKCLVEWCEIFNLKYNMVKSRIYRGWTIDEALEIIPQRKKNKNVSIF